MGREGVRKEGAAPWLLPRWVCDGRPGGGSAASALRLRRPRRQSFTQHILKLMTSWAVVCDVYFLEPQRRREGETVDAFAGRVQEMIARKVRGGGASVWGRGAVACGQRGEVFEGCARARAEMIARKARGGAWGGAGAP